MEPQFIKAEYRTFHAFSKDDRDWSGPFIFIQGADTQFGMIENYLEKKENPGWTKEIALTKNAIQMANKMSPKPKFFIVCGDLVDAYPGTSLRPAQVSDFKKTFTELNDIPLICVCGNHDVGDVPTTSTIDEYRKNFGDDYFVFYCSGVMFIVLNSQYYKDKSEVEKLAEEQDLWLDELLKKSSQYRHVVVFQHIPWFLKSADEDNEYFNIDKQLRMNMLDKFEKAGVNCVFCGHYHRNAGGKYKNVDVVVTSAIGAQLGNDQSGVRLVKVLTDRIEHTYYALNELPSQVKLQ